MGLLNKIFGPSLSDLAKKEVELKRKHSEAGGIKIPTPKVEKKILSLQAKYTLILFSIFTSFIIIIALSIAYESITRPDADYDDFKIAMKEYIDKNDAIVDMVIQDNDMFKVVVSDIWYYSSEVEKLRFCNNVRDAVYVYAHQYKLIYKDTDMVFLNFYDSTDIKVATPDMLDFKILH